MTPITTKSILPSGPLKAKLIVVSLRNRTAERRGRKNVCVWQTWQGCNLHVMSWSSLSINVFWFLQKDLFKGKWWLAKSYFKQICCHGCHTRFAVFFPLPSCCVSLLIIKLQPSWWKAYLQIVIIKKDLKNSSILPPYWPSRNKIDNNKITAIMIKSLFTNSDYNKIS